MEVVVVAPEGAQLIASGLSTEVVKIILQSRALLHEVETLHFMVRRPPARPSQLPDWYSSGVPAGQFLFKVYVVAIAAYHVPLGGQSVGRHP